MGGKEGFMSVLLRSVLFLILGALSPSQQEQVKLLDAQIEELQEKKRGYEARALRHEDLAVQLQFENDMYLDMRRQIQLADENRAKAEQIQQQIDALEQKRSEIISKK